MHLHIQINLIIVLIYRKATYLPFAAILGYSAINGSTSALRNLRLGLRFKHNLVGVPDREEIALQVLNCVEELLLAVVNAGRVNLLLHISNL